MSSVGYLISTFPVLEETFILGEILELERQGLQIEIFSLRFPPPAAQQREAERLVRRTHYCRYLFQFSIWKAVAHFLFNSPRLLAHAVWELLSDNRDDPRCLIRSLVMLPKALLFAREMQLLGIEQIHAHWATYPAAVAGFIARMLGLRYSVTAHAYDIYTDQRPTALTRRLARASFVATCSRANQQYLSTLVNGVGPAVHTVYHGVDASRFHAGSNSSDRGRTEIIAGCGTLDPRKGLRFLVDACAQLAAGGFRFRCRIVGAGPELENLKRQVADRDLGQIVDFVPPVTQSQLADYYREADIFVQPSIVCSNGDKDVIPNCLLEAMACALAVVATSVSSIPEVIEDGREGLLVPQRDGQALGQALARLIQDPALRRRLGRAARETVVGNFDRTVMTRKLRSLFCQGGDKSSQREPAARI